MRSWVVAIVAFAFAVAFPMQVNGFNQNAHYALVRALNQGTVTIDRTRHEIGELGTLDVTLVDGHYYSNKAPGLAFASQPAFGVLEAIGMRTTGDPTRVIWALHVVTVALAAVALLMLMRAVADTVAPGYGTATAAASGLGTLVLPFGTLFFAHVFSAAIAFAALSLLWFERRGPERPMLVTFAGVAAGFAVVAEYTTVLVGLALWAFVLARTPRVRRSLRYAAGVALGVAPLGVYNLVAYGSLTHFPYEGNQVEEVTGMFGLGAPSVEYAWDLLFSAWGLLVNMPVLALGLAGSVLLYRSGRRVEAAVLLGVPAVGFLHDTMLQFSPFGGLGLPRYLIYTMPFVMVPLGLVLQRLPLTTLALVGVSALQMTLMTATNPLAAYDLEWSERAANRHFSQTAAAFVEVTGWWTIGAFFAAVIVCGIAAVASLPRQRLGPTDAIVASASLAAWATVTLLAETPEGHAHKVGYVLATAGVAAALSVATLLETARAPRCRPQRS